MWYVIGMGIENGEMQWACMPGAADNAATSEVIAISYTVSSSRTPLTDRQAIERFKSSLTQNPPGWIIPRPKEWQLDLSKLRQGFPELASLSWLQGNIAIQPEVETRPKTVGKSVRYSSKVSLYLDAELVREEQAHSENRMGGRQMIVEPIWHGREFRVEEDLCFVLMPFREPFNTIYQDHLKPTIEGVGLRCVRADDIYGTTPIMEDIWEQVCRARVLVAELTGRNPNVFYEIGMAHTLGKDVVLVAQTTDDIPFDLRALRCIIYDYNPRGAKRLETALEKTLHAVMGKPTG